MSVRLLGSLEIERDGAVVAIGAKQRRLLVALALEPHGVRREVLEERLSLSRGGLRTSITRLRAAVGAETIQSIDNGYRLKVDFVDVDRFEALAKQASEGDAQKQVELLTEALALWRGPALVDVADEEWARPTAVRLNELAAAAEEDLAEALIDVGRTTDAIAQLRITIERHPYRDRPCALLMMALAAEGRQTEALRSFNDHRTRLIDEIGIDPSEALIELDRQISMGEGLPTAAAVGVIDPLPTEGLLTFLFTDIVGSTQLWQQDPVAMHDALERHDAILTSIFHSNGGHIVKHTGDGFMAVFVDAHLAVSAAIEAHQMLDLPIRIGVHCGTANHRDNDYFGPTVNRAARIMSVGHGGQILVSADALPFLGDHDTIDLGRHHLRDSLEPEVLLQVVDPTLRTDFPRLEGAVGTPHNLPQHPAPLIGRVDEIASVSDLVRANRMVSLIGVGGAGKTRLATAVAKNLLDDFPHGVWFIELANLSEKHSIASTIRQALGLPDGGLDDDADIDDIAAHLANRKLLLVLDNCEHLGEAPGLIAERLLTGAGDVQVLATSRTVVGVAGEVLRQVAGMSVVDATGLFEARARAARPDIELRSDDLATVRDICSRLDQLPLGVELVAAQASLLDPGEIRDRLDSALELQNKTHSVGDRQKSLRVAMTWSYESLSEPTRQLLAQLSVFAGLFTLDAAEAVCALDGPGDITHGLGDILRTGLLTRDPETRRYRLLHLVREFASEQLGDQEQQVRHRHAAHHTAYVGALRRDIYRAGAVADASDLANLRDAAAFLIDQGDAHGLVELIVAGEEYWSHAGAAHDVETWLEAALAMPVELPVDLLVGALSSVTSALTIARPSGGTAIELGERAVELSLGDQASERSRFVAASDLGYAHVHADASNPIGSEWLTRSLDHCENDPMRIMRSNSRLSVAAFIGGHPELGLAPAEQAVAIAMAAHVTIFEQVARSFRAATRAVLGDRPGALEDLAELNDVPASLDPVWRGTIHVTAANAWLALDNHEAAAAHLMPALQIPLAEIGEVICTMIGSTACMIDVLPPELVATAIGAVEQFHSASQPMLASQLSHGRLRALAQLGEETFTIAHDRGKHETITSINQQLATALADLSDELMQQLAC